MINFKIYGICVLAMLVHMFKVCASDNTISSFLWIISDSTLIVTATVEKIVVNKNQYPNTLVSVKVVGNPYKGDFDSDMLVFSHQADSSKTKSVLPISFKLHEKYLLFLVKRNNAYQLTDAFSGAINESETSPAVMKKIYSSINEMKKLEESTEALELALEAEKNVLSKKEPLSLLFTIYNRSDKTISLPARFSSGNYVDMKGLARIIFRTLREGKINNQAVLGGPIKADVKFTLNPKEKKTWRKFFNWGDYGEDVGDYELIWKVGKAKSNSVRFRRESCASSPKTKE